MSAGAGAAAAALVPGGCSDGDCGLPLPAVSTVTPGTFTLTFACCRLRALEPANTIFVEHEGNCFNRRRHEQLLTQLHDLVVLASTRKWSSDLIQALPSFFMLKESSKSSRAKTDASDQLYEIAGG